ncbi:MAG: uncharacterized protein JWL85_911 [Candidatus Saccharibacteria bacterium]|nr:uncharacterized protein [Candidatus Saccharibacteria bacterium]
MKSAVVTACRSHPSALRYKQINVYDEVMKKTLLIALLSFTLTLVAAAPAFAAPANSPPRLGIDISWPQCNKSVPKDQAFGIVGVNGGLASNTNSCLSTQLQWAHRSVGGTQQPRAQLYVNTANPGEIIDQVTTWPKNNVDPAGRTAPNPYGTCDGTNTLACSWQYGWNRAVEAAYDRFKPAAQKVAVDSNAANYIWWLDVETENTWQSGSSAALARNAATLEGMTALYHSVGAKVGLYSTALQWGQIVGTVSTSSNLNGLINWRPGGANLTTAKDACKAAPLTAGGKVVMTQFIQKNLDYNYSCIL